MGLEETKKYANAFNLIPELGPIKLTQILTYFSDFQTAWSASEKDYLAAGLPQKTVNQIIARKDKINPEVEAKKLEDLGIDMLLVNSPQYPPLLKQIHACPPILYIRGSVEVLKTLAIAMVGTRKMSTYGRQATQEITTGLVQSGITIVSGLAFGVDAQALMTCVELGGKGVAVLASDISDDGISPRANYNLAQKIIQSGALISEYPLGMSIQKQNFPIRNRIISGLSVGTIVVEADKESGALITAQYSLEQNREVFAVPGSIFSPVSLGTNSLIKDGARMVTTSQDVIIELNLDINTAPMETTTEESAEENEILSILTREPQHIEELIRRIDLSVAKINATLTMLEMKGRVKNLGNGNYVKIR
jgi:DNA processing protein